MEPSPRRDSSPAGPGEGAGSRGRLLEAWRAGLRRWVESPEREDQVFLALTLIIGALVGLAVVAFILLTERLAAGLFPKDAATWRRLVVPVLGALVAGALLYRYFPEARGSGVPQTRAALFIRDGVISLRTVVGKFFCTSLTLASGIPLGREGPSVQVGAGIASVLGRRLGLGRERLRQLVPVGTAAAIAAAFNTPMAAVLFVLEEILGDLHAPLLGSVVVSAGTSWLALRLLLGNEPLFHVPTYRLVNPVELVVYALLGVLGGLVSVGFIKLLLGMRKRFLQMPVKTQIVQPVAGAAAVGVMGFFVPEALGVGYAFVGAALNGLMAAPMMALLVVLKVVGVATSYASGNAGGIFGPSLFIGAMLGGAVGSFAHWLLPAYTALPGAYALVGMGALFAGVVRVPFTSIIMIFELTHDYEIIVPLMIANLTSLFISRRLQRIPIYEGLSLQEGIHLPSHGDGGRDSAPRVRDAMRAPHVGLAQMTVAQALAGARELGVHAWPAADDQGLRGILTLARIEEASASGRGDERLSRLAAGGEFPHLHPDQPLHVALERMGAEGVDLLPVVSRADTRALEGVLLLHDLLGAYGVRRRPSEGTGL